MPPPGERWLGRVGVAFVVLAFGFLFRYALDQGWIGPAPRLVLLSYLINRTAKSD